MRHKSEISTIVNQQNIQKNNWADGCYSWHYLNQNPLSIKREEMAPNTSEKLHYHNIAQQFFYMLEGAASLEINQQAMTLHKGEGIHIPSKTAHKISNNTESKIEFLVISNPPIQNDRILVTPRNENKNP